MDVVNKAIEIEGRAVEKIAQGIAFRRYLNEKFSQDEITSAVSSYVRSKANMLFTGGNPPFYPSIESLIEKVQKGEIKIEDEDYENAAWLYEEWMADKKKNMGMLTSPRVQVMRGIHPEA
jgi:organic radical activating enzyme